MSKLVTRAILGIDSLFAHIGVPLGVFFKDDLLVVASEFGGCWHSNRISVFDAHAKLLQAFLDQIRHPINDVAFHPTNSHLLAIATGSYDGGFLFEGELLIWDWKTGEIRNILRENIEVKRVRFSKDGSQLDIITTPPNEEAFEEGDTGNEVIYDRTYFHSDIPFSGQNKELKYDKWIDCEKVGFSKKVDDYGSMLKTIVPAYEVRSGVHDVAWLEDNLVCCTTPEKQIEIWNKEGARRTEIPGENCFGTQLITFQNNVFVNVQETCRDSYYQTLSRLIRVKKSGECEIIRRFPNSIDMISFSNDSLLIKTECSRYELSLFQVLFKDNVFEILPALPNYRYLQFYPRVKQEKLYFCREDRNQIYQNDTLCSLDPRTGAIKELWPAAWDDSIRGRVYLNTACISQDKFICESTVPLRSEAGYRNVITVRNLQNGRLLSVFGIESSVVTLVPLDNLEKVFYSLKNGAFGLVDLKVRSSAVVGSEFTELFSIDGISSPINCADWNGKELVTGTADGRIIIFDVC